MIYKPVSGSRLSNEQAERYGQRLSVLVEENNGALTPEQVVEDAKEPTSPLHDYFMWDNAKAAAQWRLDQARYLMRSITVVIKREDTKEEESARYLYNIKSVPVDEEIQQVYVPIQRVMAEEDLRSQVIEEALRKIEHWRARYRQYREFATIFTAIDQVREVLG